MICISLVNKKYEECLRITGEAPLVELRLDKLDVSADQAAHLCGQKARVVVTCRSGTMKEEDRLLLLRRAIISGAAYVDLDMKTDLPYHAEFIELLKDHDCELILSYHNFELTQSYEILQSLITEGIRKGGDLVKIACQVNGKNDIIKLMRLYEIPERIIAVGMGQLGKVIRLLSLYLGAEFTYAAYEEGHLAAPGQMTSEQMEQMIQVLGAPGQTS